MARKLPPLSPLKAFDVSARTLSFTLAAEELNLTQAAVSHQIKTLEDAIGHRLFVRMNRALRLTEEGAIMQSAVRDSLARLERLMRDLSDHEKSGALTVTTLSSFASSWLVPRLSQFRMIHPDIDLRISANDMLVDFEKQSVDVAVRWGQGRYPGLRSEYLMREDVFVVCSPKLLEGRYPLNKPDDLRYHTLLHDDFDPDWASWLKSVGVNDVDPNRGTLFNHSELVLQAAIDGQGVALGRSQLAKRAMEMGLLVKPFEQAIPHKNAYYFVCPEWAFERPKVQAFLQWLKDEIAIEVDDE